MDERMLKYLKERYSYETWAGRNALKENLFIWKYFFSGNEFPNWQAHRLQPVETMGWPPAIQSVWRRSTGDNEVLLKVDTFECPSRISAHDFLLQLLGEFESPLLGRQEGLAIGDVIFGGPQKSVIIFSRANLVLLMRNAGRKLVELDEIARVFDQDLVSKEGKVEEKVVPEIQRFLSPGKELQVNEFIPMELEASDPLARPVWYKFFSLSGEVMLEEGRLVYRSAAAGPQKIKVFAINANRGAASRELHLVVK